MIIDKISIEILEYWQEDLKAVNDFLIFRVMRKILKFISLEKFCNKIEQ